MKKTHGIMHLILVFLFLLSGCTVDISQSDTRPATVPTAQVLMETFTPSAQKPANQASTPGIHIPITWSDLNLKGKLVFLSAEQKEYNPVLSVQQLDLVSGELTTLYKSPELSWIYSFAISPDGKQLVICYTPPAVNGSMSTQGIYQVPLDGTAQPLLLIPAPQQSDQYLQPEWSPDGKYLYYSHVNYKTVTKAQHYPTFEIYRMVYPNGAPEKIADQAFWPRLSADGSKLVYISSDPLTGKNQIIVANPDGQNAQSVQMSGAVVPDIIDAPIFSHDGNIILFSASTPPKAAEPSWLERALGITVVDAHSVPSEWWSVPASGGTVTQLTNLQFAGLFASFAPDGQHVASYSASGLFVMNPDASGVTMIIQDLGGIYGTVSWLP